MLLTLPGIRELSGSPARVADLACGDGWSSLALARAWPFASIDGFDPSAASVAQARRRAGRERLARRVRFYEYHANAGSLWGSYDLVTILRPSPEPQATLRLLETAAAILDEGGQAILAESPGASALGVVGFTSAQTLVDGTGFRLTRLSP